MCSEPESWAIKRLGQPCASSSPRDPNCGASISGRKGAPTLRTGTQLDCLRGGGLYPRWPFLSLYSSSPSSAFCQPQRFRALSPGPGGLAPASEGPVRPLTERNPSALFSRPESLVIEHCMAGYGRPRGSQVAAHVEGTAGAGADYPLWLEHSIGVQDPTLSTCPVVPGASGLGRYCPKLSPHEMGKGASLA